MRLKHNVLVLVLAALASSCSYLLDSVLAPFAPDFLPELSDVPGGVAVRSDIVPTAKPCDTDMWGPTSWDMPYALYVFRSGISPYDGMRLVARYYLDNAAVVFTGQDARVETVYDSGKPQSDHIVLSHPLYDYALTEGYDVLDELENAIVDDDTFIDASAPPGQLYYRLSKIWLYRTVTKVTFTLNSYSAGVVTGTYKETATEISYSLSSSVSGWASIANTP
jgi:hypothetical protein